MSLAIVLDGELVIVVWTYALQSGKSIEEKEISFLFSMKRMDHSSHERTDYWNQIS